MGTDDPAERESVSSLQREVEELRAENARLRGLLGLDDRSREGHAEAWAPTLLTEPATQPVVDNLSPWEDKLGLFRSLFGARSDVYTKRLPAYATLGFDIPKTRRRPRPPAPSQGTDTDAF